MKNKYGTVVALDGKRYMFMAYDGHGIWYDGENKFYTGLEDEDIRYKNKQEFIYEPIPVDYSKERNYGLDDIDKNWDGLRKIDEQQKEKGLKYRYLRFPYADGYAVYQIVDDIGSKVRVLHVTGLGDDWLIPEIPDGSYISKNTAEINISRRDNINSFSKRNRRENK